MGVQQGRYAALLLTLGMLLGGCSPRSGDRVVIPATVATTYLACGNPAPSKVPDKFAKVLDVVALPTGNYPSALQTSSGVGEGTTRLFAKAGLWYRPDQDFSVEVTDLDGTVSIGWGGAPSTPVARVVNHACKSDGHDWVVVQGGYWTGTVGCKRLLVRAGTRSQEVRIGVGAPCEGQTPPEQPSVS